MMNFEENRIEMGRNIKKYLALNGMNAQELANHLINTRLTTQKDDRLAMPTALMCV